MSISSVFKVAPRRAAGRFQVATMAAVAAPVPEPAARPPGRRPDPGLGVFETLLVVAGRAVELEAHLERLAASLEELYGEGLPPDLPERVEERAHGVAAGGLRVTVSPGPAGGLRVRIPPPRPLPPGAFVSLYGTKEPSAPVEGRGVVVPGGLGPHKWADRSLLEEAAAGMPPDAAPVVLDADGAVLEASRASLFAVRGGALLTPPLDGRVLPGIVRAAALGIAAAEGVETREEALSREDLAAAEEVFLTGSLRGVEPLGSLDGAELQGEGEITRLVAAGLRRRWLGEPRPQAPPAP